MANKAKGIAKEQIGKAKLASGNRGEIESAINALNNRLAEKENDLGSTLTALQGAKQALKEHAKDTDEYDAILRQIGVLEEEAKTHKASVKMYKGKLKDRQVDLGHALEGYAAELHQNLGVFGMSSMLESIRQAANDAVATHAQFMAQLKAIEGQYGPAIVKNAVEQLDYALKVVERVQKALK